MMTLDEIKALDRISDPAKLLPTTIAFLKEMRAEANAGRQRRDEPIIPWIEADEARYDQKAEALRIGRIEFASAGATRKR